MKTRLFADTPTWFQLQLILFYLYVTARHIATAILSVCSFVRDAVKRFSMSPDSPRLLTTISCSISDTKIMLDPSYNFKSDSEVAVPDVAKSDRTSVIQKTVVCVVQIQMQWNTSSEIRPLLCAIQLVTAMLCDRIPGSN